MNQAALQALIDDNMENFIIASTPGGIQRQEARGNQAFVANSTLPKCEGKDKEYLEQMGIVFGEDADDLFVNVQLPDGWSKQHGEDSRGSYLVDSKGNKRASIFYKAAFYDRYASISLMRRYSARYESLDKDNRKASGYVGMATDRGVEIWRSDEIEPEPPYPIQSDENYPQVRLDWLAWSDKRKGLGKLAGEWLDENYPDWRSPVAYWE